MNIGHMARAFIGDSKLHQQDAKVMALKDGQVVRGVVLQLLDGNEALISVNGARIRAHLETPLQTGQAAWLQVQPRSAEGQLILRTLALSHHVSTEELVVRLMQQLGLKDTLLNREIIQQAHELGVQLHTKDAKLLSSFLSRAEAPMNLDSAKWTQSAIITQQRGLPLTAQTVQSISAALHGGSLPVQLMHVREQLIQLLATTDSSATQLSSASQPILSRLADTISDWLGQASAGRWAAQDSSQAGLRPLVASENSMLGGRSTAPTDQSILAQTNRASIAHEPSSTAPMSSLTNVASSGMTQGTGAHVTIPAATNTMAMQDLSAIDSNIPRPGQPNDAVWTARSTVGPAQTHDSNQHIDTHIGRTIMEGNPAPTEQVNLAQVSRPQALEGVLLRQLLVGLGFGYEHDLMERFVLDRPSMSGGVSLPLSSMLGHMEPGDNASAQGLMQQPTADSVKSLLLQSLGLEQLPTALREAIQQAAQTITGQQLLMTADRSAPFNYITLFVPFFDEKGQQMASVHVQTRKGKRGQLDSDNCNLLFDLRLSTLGELMIDVQVTERIVALRIFNEHPLIQALVEEGKPHIQQAIEDLGYRLSHMKTLPLPTTISSSDTAQSTEPQTLLRRYASGNTYKGVDLRI